MSIVISMLLAIQIISSITLIILVISQTTKSEGLSGTIGGKSSSSFRGKPGADEKLSGLTRWAAVLFMATSFMVYFLSSRAL